MPDKSWNSQVFFWHHFWWQVSKSWISSPFGQCISHRCSFDKKIARQQFEQNLFKILNYLIYLKSIYFIRLSIGHKMPYFLGTQHLSSSFYRRLAFSGDRELFHIRSGGRFSAGPTAWFHLLLRFGAELCLNQCHCFCHCVSATV